MHSYKLKISHSLIIELDQFIKLLVELETTTNDQKLLVATIAQIGAITDSKIGMFKPIAKSYVLKLNVAQMYAIIILSNDYVTDVQTYLGNFLQSQSFKIQKNSANNCITINQKHDTSTRRLPMGTTQHR